MESNRDMHVLIATELHELVNTINKRMVTLLLVNQI